MKIIIAALLPLFALVSPEAITAGAPADVAVRGPYHFTLPVPGLRPADEAALTKALEAEFGNRRILELDVQEGYLSFYAGGHSAKALLHLSRLERSLAKCGFSLNRRSWVLRQQPLGLVLGSKGAVGGPALKKAVAKVKGVAVIGTMLEGGKMVMVIEIEKDVPLSDLSKGLAKVGASIDDLLWGHWKYGWDIEPKHHGHACGIVTEGAEAHDHDHKKK